MLNPVCFTIIIRKVMTAVLLRQTGPVCGAKQPSDSLPGACPVSGGPCPTKDKLNNK